MKYHNTLIALGTILLIGFSLPASAAPGEEAAQQAAEAEERQAQIEAEYREAMSVAEERQTAAESAIEKTRALAQRAAEESQRASADREAELAAMYEELNRARKELQETSREVARVSREVARARAGSRTYVYQATERPVIGVVLGDADETGARRKRQIHRAFQRRIVFELGDIALGQHRFADHR